jgi:hypothetical protein
VRPRQLAGCRLGFDKSFGGRVLPAERCLNKRPIGDACKKALDNLDNKRREGTLGTKNQGRYS